MPTVQSNGLRIAYEEHGNPEDPVMLMVQGLGMPLTAWPPAFIDALVIEGFRVIVFDNRDIGRSQLLSHMKVPNVLVQTAKVRHASQVSVPTDRHDARYRRVDGCVANRDGTPGWRVDGWHDFATVGDP